MSYIIYSKNINNTNDTINNINNTTNNIQYGIKPINNKLFKKLMYNKIHKKCKFSISKEKIKNEFGIEFNDNLQTNDLSKDDLLDEDSNCMIANDFDDDINNLDELNETNTNEQTNTSDSNVDVLIMGELNEKQLETYLELYRDEQDNLEKFVEFLSIILYNQISFDKYIVKKKINEILNSLGEYWENPYNCNYTLTDKFHKRKFNNANYNGFDNNTLNSVKSNFDIKWNSKEIDYLKDIIKFNDWKEMCIKQYYVPIKSKFTNEEFVQIYKQLPTEYAKYIFISNILCSRIHCHLILNNKEFLEISKPLFIKYKLIFKYLIGYAWITLKNEEQHVYHKITDKDRIIFDIETVKLLPKYPFTYDDINQNPYACVLVDTNVLDIKKNCLSMEMMRDYEKYYGVCDSKEFERRLNIFVNNGTNQKGILQHIDWDCCVISGSVMTACGMKYNPLFDICKTDNNMNVLTDNDFANYIFHYYSDSDVDLICNKNSIYDFIDVVNTFVSKANTHYKNTSSVSNVHTGTMIVSDEFLLEELDSINKILNDGNNQNTYNVSFIKSNFSNPDIIKYFYSKYYIPWKNEQKEFLINSGKDIHNALINDYLKPVPEQEFRLYNFDYNMDKCENYDYEKYFYSKSSNGSKNTNIIAKLSESIRFKVSNQHFKTFEIFKSKNTNFFSTVSKFHMGFVRALWNGKTVLCLPSYITSMMLQLAVDYKYLASIRDPIEIVNKYRSRGFGIILNGQEKLHMVYYNSLKLDDKSNSKWIEMYKIDIKSKQSIENMFGVKKSSHDIFKPSKYFLGIPEDCYKKINHDTVSTFDQCFSSFIVGNHTLILSKAKAINDNGKINPLYREIINLGWELLSK